jgi:acyl-CoA thioesterase-2
MAIAHFELAHSVAPGRFSWQPSPLLLTPNNTLQGGAGLGVAVAAMEYVTQRPTIWATAQYLSFAVGTTPIEVEVAIAVTGHNTTQARCVLLRDGKEVLTAHSALGRREFELEGVWCDRPDVDPPERCPRYRFFESGRGHIGDHAEFRLARGRQLDEIEASDVRGDGSFALWIRCWSGQELVSVADLAFIGDFMPLGFADASGKPYAGNSLDNTIRVGNLVQSEWILLAVHVQQIANGFGYGRAELWAEDGTLLGEVSQTAVLRTHAHIKATTRPN